MKDSPVKPRIPAFGTAEYHEWNPFPFPKSESSPPPSHTSISNNPPSISLSMRDQIRVETAEGATFKLLSIREAPKLPPTDLQTPFNKDLQSYPVGTGGSGNIGLSPAGKARLANDRRLAKEFENSLGLPVVKCWLRKVLPPTPEDPTWTGDAESRDALAKYNAEPAARQRPNLLTGFKSPSSLNVDVQQSPTRHSFQASSSAVAGPAQHRDNQTWMSDKRPRYRY